MSLIAETTATYWALGRKLKHTQKGWLSGNAVCCHHNGTSADTRSRGGLMILDQSVTWHCFNCGFKCSWHAGSKLSPKFKNLLKWLNVPDELITKCAFDALRTVNEHLAQNSAATPLLPKFHNIELPVGTGLISDFINKVSIPHELVLVIEYLLSRQLTLDDYNWMWCDQPGFNDRLIIPFYYQGRLVGYTARRINGKSTKYLSEQQSGYVFNLDHQTFNRKYVIVTEGPIDAICVDGVSLMGSEIQAGQQHLINQLQKQVILVPDRDTASIKLVDQAIKQGWSVSFPEWGDPKIKDINEAVKEYGKIGVLIKILDSVKSTEVSIKVASKLWFKGGN